jgi:predicted ATPase/class 3 adenylate cyclase
VPAPRSLPTGTVTFLFTDIEGSTNLARTLGDRWVAILQQHNEILRSAIREHAGVDLRTEGDAFFAVFASAVDAARAAATAQQELARHPWPEGGRVRVRMGLHTGEGRLGGDEYVGLDVHLAARIAAAAHGGQVLLSDATRSLVADSLNEDIVIRDLGEHRLKDFDDAQRLHQLTREGLPADFPPLRTRMIPSTLPVPLTTFVGRQRELADLTGLIGRTRLLTLAGPGGTGKTRLAIEAAGQHLRDFLDGVFFVDLSPVRDPELIASAVAQTMGLREQAGQSSKEALVEHLHDRRALLMLDNFEQVVAGAPLVTELLRAAPRMSILVTSRIRLDVAGEQAFDVPPLGLPPETGPADAEDLAANEAVVLFADRARAVRPGFEITDENAGVVADICARLDGLPLAIELAAAQLRLFSPRELLDRLQHRLPLRTTTRDVPERQRTLRDTIDWSYRLLEGPERALLARLSVFAGGGTVAAIEAVCNPDGDLGIDTLEALGSLVDKSLIRREELAEGSRFTMLETIREYAAERLAGSHGEATERRHAEFFTALAEQWGPRVRGPDAPAAYAVLGHDYDNLRSAISWAVREEDGSTGLRLVTAMWRLWVERGPLTEAQGALETVLSLPSASPRAALRAGALNALGAVTYWRGDYEGARRAYADVLEISREVGDQRGVVEALKNLAYTTGAGGDAPSAVPLAQEALAMARTMGDPALAADAAGLLGIVWHHSDQPGRALAVLQEALDGFEALGDTYWANQTRFRIGSVLVALRRLDEAEGVLKRAMADTSELPSPLAVATGIWIMATLAFERAEFERAVRLMGFSLALAEHTETSPPGAYLGDLTEHLATARAKLGEEAIERLRAEGKAMSTEQAIAYALGKT